MKFTKVCKEMLEPINYNETIAYCAQQLSKCNNLDQAEELANELDDKIWDLAVATNMTDIGLRITTALPIMIDNLNLEYDLYII